MIEGYDNDFCLIDFIRNNKWIKEMHLDVQYHESKCIKYDDGYKPPFDGDGNEISSVSRLERLVLYHGAKSEKSRNDILAEFPPQLIS